MIYLVQLATRNFDRSDVKDAIQTVLDRCKKTTSHQGCVVDTNPEKLKLKIDQGCALAYGMNWPLKIQL